MTKERSQPSESPSPYEAAIDAAFRDLDEVDAIAAEARAQLAGVESRRAQLTDLIRSLASQLPRERQACRITELQSRTANATASTRAGETVNNVIQLFASEPKEVWTAAEVQSAYGERFGPTDAKAVYNALATLERSGRLWRMSRGRYFDKENGVGVLLPDDLQLDGPQKGGAMED